MFSFQLFSNKIKQNSEEKVKACVYANWYGNTIFVFLLMLFFSDICMYLRIGVNNTLFLIVNIVILFCLFYYLVSRRAGIGITENRIVYVQFGHFGYKVKKVFEIPVDKIRMITVRKFFGLKYVKISFISDVGKLEKIRFLFSSFVLGFNLNEYRKNSNEVYQRLREVEKVVDKGDF